MEVAPVFNRSSSVSSLTRLPSELILRILECSSPSSLKQLRGTCKNLKALANPLLWNTIYLYPHMDHFRQILALSMHPPVRCHVHQIVYDLRWAHLPDHILKRIRSVYSTRVKPSEKNAAQKRVQHAKNGTLDPGRDDDIELLFLQDILRNLVSLESITVLENNSNQWYADGVNLDELPSYYQKLREATCGSLPDTDLEPGVYNFCGRSRSTKRILVATHSLGSRIQNFEVYNAHWDHITAFEREGKHLDLLRPFIVGLKSLTLHAGFEGHLTAGFLMSNLGIVLDLAVSLESLDLSFGITLECDPPSEHDDWSSDEGSTIQSKSLLHIIESSTFNGASKWGTGLKRLALSEVRCSSSDLINVLKRCAPTLKDLALNHLELIPEPTDQDAHDVESPEPQKPCLVRLLTEIRSILHLNTIWLSHFFRNSGRQVWELNPEALSNSSPNTHPTTPLLTEQIFEYILGAAHNPLAPLSILPSNTDITETQLNSSWHLDDASFQFQTIFDTADLLSSGLSPESIYALHDAGIDVSVSSPLPLHENDNDDDGNFEGRSPASPLLSANGVWEGPPSSPVYEQSPWSPLPELEEPQGTCGWG